MVLPFLDEDPVFQAIRCATDFAPVIPHNLSWSISAAICTRRASMVLRWPVSSATSSNSTSRRSFGSATAPDEAFEDMTPYKHQGLTSD